MEKDNLYYILDNFGKRRQKLKFSCLSCGKEDSIHKRHIKNRREFLCKSCAGKKISIGRKRKSPKINKSKYSVVLERFLKGENPKDIGLSFNCSDVTIRKILKSMGLSFGKRKSGVEKRFSFSEIVELYNRLGSLSAVSKRIKEPEESIGRFLEKNNFIFPANPIKVFFEEKKEYIINAYLNGDSGWKIAKELGCDGRTLYEYLNKWGVKLKDKRIGVSYNIFLKNKDFICNLYYDKKMSLEEISNLIKDISTSQLARCFDRNKLPKRSSCYSIYSSIERRFSELLEKDEIKYIYQFKLHKKKYDFYLPDQNLLIEINGDYWHGNPEKYKVFSKIQLASKERDLLKTKIAKDNGFFIRFIWEKDIKSNLDKVKKFIKNIKEIKILNLNKEPLDSLELC